MLVTATCRRVHAVMKSSVVAVVLVMTVCVAVICESAAVSRQREVRSAATAADDLTRWLSGFVTKRRYVSPPAKHLAPAAQKRRRTVSRK